MSVGKHKVVIRSANKNYIIKKTSKIVIKKQKAKKKSSLKTVILKVKTLAAGEYYSKKCTRLKKGDAALCFREDYEMQYSRGVHVICWYLGNGDEDIEPHHCKLIKAKFYFKNSYGKVITRNAKADYYGDHVSTNLISGYRPYKTKVWYKVK